MTSEAGSIRTAVIDADTGFVRVLTKRLEGMGWRFRVLSAPVPAEELVAMRLNAVIIDLAALGPRAWEFLEYTCAILPELGVIVCTGQSTVQQRVRGLRLGADDWITKPSHPEEVLARVEAVVRRRKRASLRAEAGPLVLGELEIRADRFQAFVGGRGVDLTRREFEVLQVLAEAGGRVLEREEIYQRVWGYAMARGDRSVDVFVRKLRQKLEQASPSWRYIHTHFGIGYRFHAEAGDLSRAAQVREAEELPPVEQPGQARQLPPSPALAQEEHVARTEDLAEAEELAEPDSALTR